MLNEQQMVAVYNFIYGITSLPSGDDLEHGWKAVKAIAAGDGKLSDPERQCLLGKMCAVHMPPGMVERVMAWDEHSAAPVALLEHVRVPKAYRRGVGAWMVYEGLSVSNADGEIAPGEMEAVRRVAQTMDVPPATVDALHAVVKAEAEVRARRVATLFGTINDEVFRFEK